MELTPAMQEFVLHWGEMGSRWGVNRSVAQVHALLHLSPDPLHAEEIAETLGIARSNVSTAVRELEGWGLICVSRQLGDRRDHFTAERDLFEVVRLVVEGRRNREFLPTLRAVEGARELAEGDGKTPTEVVQRMRETHEMMEMFDSWYAQVARLPRSSQLKMLKLGAQLARFLPKSE
ncbi:MAG: MarR family transcriptional regulator [Pseudomonadota bacterium]